jgi:NAD(P)-dependent dehydrogenase (short-subunit alcohol dehydrogenase family)
MASIWVTGSSAGIGQETALVLVNGGHRVVLHARSHERAADAQKGVPVAAAVVIGDLSSLEETRALAEAAPEQGPFDAVVHNAGIGGGNGTRALTGDGLDPIFQVNVLAPYVLTALMPRPRRLVYLSSGLHYQGVFDPGGPERGRRPGDAMKAYCGAKLCDVLLAFAVARLWPPTLSNAVDPGWIRTRMRGRGAPGSVSRGPETPVWLATSDDPSALVSAAT